MTPSIDDASPDDTAGNRASKRTRAIILAIGALTLGLWLALAAQSSLVNAPAWHEPVQLMSGLSIWRFGRFDWFQVNPPMVRIVAALPVLAMHPRLDPELLDRPPAFGQREEFAAASAFVRNTSPPIRNQIIAARWACLLFGTIGAIVCWRWASVLYGDYSGLLALSLWCFSPYILGHGSTIMNDVPAAAIGVAAFYFFWRWLKKPTFWEAIVAGTVLGLAELCKFTMLISYPILPLIWVLYRLGDQQQLGVRDWLKQLGMLIVAIVVSIHVINCGYLFEGTFTPLKEYHFQSKLFTGFESLYAVSPQGANRFADVWVGDFPAPLPADYIQGIDTLRLDFERGFSSYLGGEWSDGGWWYYYLYALAIKMPLGTWLLVAMAVTATVINSRFSANWRDEMVVLVPFFALLGFVSFQSSISVHSRYVIPALPFLFIWTSKIATAFELRYRAIAAVTLLGLIWSIGSSLAIYPHSLSYFNELIGGPTNGPKYLLNSNIDWGQDLYFLKNWLNDRPEVRLNGLAYDGFLDASLAGIPKTPLPIAALPNLEPKSGEIEDGSGPHPGWYALSVNYLYSQSAEYRYFLRFKPEGLAGYSIYIYHVTIDDANQVRRDLGLSELRGVQ